MRPDNSDIPDGFVSDSVCVGYLTVAVAFAAVTGWRLGLVWGLAAFLVLTVALLAVMLLLNAVSRYRYRRARDRERAALYAALEQARRRGNRWIR